ncbi:Uncharacterised protein [Mycobacterium tuberculosis]|nr:Uncharacterised protein [Mycobacterium tuberculosis]
MPWVYKAMLAAPGTRSPSTASCPRRYASSKTPSDANAVVAIAAPAAFSSGLRHCVPSGNWTSTSGQRWVRKYSTPRT